jgi:hypothetical protein
MKLNKLLLTLLMFSLCTSAFSQVQYSWHKKNGNAGLIDEASSVAIDPNGNSIIAGYVRGSGSSADFNIAVNCVQSLGGAASTTCRTPYIAKVDNAGNVIWMNNFQSIVSGQNVNAQATINRVRVDANGNIYALFLLAANTVDVDPGPGVVSIVGINRPVVVKYDANGNFLWKGEITGSVVAQDIKLYNNQLYMVGYFSTNNTNDFNWGAATNASAFVGFGTDVLSVPFVAQYDLNGNYQQLMYPTLPQMGNAGLDPNSFEDRAYAQEVTVNAAGDIYIAGYHDIYFNNNPQARGNFILKFNSAGVYTDAAYLSNTINSVITFTSMENDNSNVYLAGHFASGGSGTDFDPGAPVVNQASCALNTYGGFLYKLNDTLGYVGFAKIFNNSCAGIGAGNQVRVSEMQLKGGSLYIGGHFSYAIDFDPGAGIVADTATNSTNTVASYDGFIAKYSTALVYQNSLSPFNGTASEAVVSLDVSPFGDIIVGGTYYGNMPDINPGAGTVNVDTIGLGDAYFVKYLDCVPAINITAPPVAQTACTGNNITLSVGATGSGLTYQWRKGGINVTGNATATTPNLVITNAQSSNSGNYDVVISSPCAPTVTTTPVLLTVNTSAVAAINTSAVICSNANTTLTASGGTGYLWSTGATTAAINISSTGNYTVTVNNAANCPDTVSYVWFTPTGLNTGLEISYPFNNNVLDVSGNNRHATLTVGNNGIVTTTDRANATNAAYQFNGQVANIRFPAGAINISQDRTISIWFKTGQANSPILGFSNVTPANPGLGGGTAYVPQLYIGNSGKLNFGGTGSAIVNIATPNTVNDNNWHHAAFSRTAAGAVTLYLDGQFVGSATGDTYAYTGTPNYYIGAANVGPPTPDWNYVVSAWFYLTGKLDDYRYYSRILSPEEIQALYNAPLITTQPVGGTACVTGADTLTVGVYGNPLSYQWKQGATPLVNGAGINGANNDTLILNPIALGSAGSYTVDIIGQGCLTQTSSAAVITVNNVPVITTPPTAQSLCTGLTANFSVVATGAVSYQWRKNTTNITGNATATTANLQLTNVQAGDAGNYDVVITNTCGNVTTTPVALTITTTPVAQISGTASICIGGSTTLTASGGGTYTWSTGATTAAITVSPASNITYTVTVSQGGSCTATASQLVTVNSLPTAAVTGTNTICNGASTNLTASGGGTYLWSTGATTAAITVSPAATTTYTVTVTNANNCTASANRTVTVNSLPSASISGNSTICAGASTTLTASGGGTYLWSTGATTAAITVNPAANTTYTVTVTNANSCTASASQLVTVNSLPSAAVSGTNTICAGTSTTLTASGGTSYAWSTGATTAAITVSPAATTTYTVTVTNANNCTATATRTVTVNSLPTPQISGNTTICSGTSTTLTASGGSSYAWSTGAVTAAITVSPTSGTTYTVTVTNANGCTASTSTSITVNSLPSASVTGTNTICAGGSTTLTAGGGGTYLWSNGANTAAITVNPASTTTYTVTVSNANNCTALASRTVTVNSLPNAAINGNTTICAGVSTTLTASGGTGYLWSTGATTAAITVNPTSTATYTVTVTNAASCTATASSTVTVNALPNAAINGPTAICTGLSANLTASGGTSYLWNTSATTAAITVTPASTTTYTVTVTNAANCTATATQTVTVNTTPTAAISGTATICAGSSTTLTANGGNTYTWSTGATTAAITVTPAVNTTYSVTVSLGGSCTASASQLVTVNSLPTPAVTGNNVICAGASTTLTASGGGTYLWSTGATTAAITVTPANTTTYTVTVTNANNCTASANRTVTVNSLPAAAISGNNVICAGASTTLTASGGTSYVWSNGATTAAINVSPASATTYTVTVTNANNCSATSSSSVTVNAIPNASVSGSATVCAGTSATLTASGGTGYTWNTGATTAALTASPNSTTTYTVTVTNANNCTASASGTITVYSLPNAGINGATTICAGNSTTLTASGGTSYAWSNVGNTAAITVSPANTTTYTVTVTNANNCTATSSVSVIVNANPVATITGNNVICNGATTTLTASGGTLYAWSDGQTVAAAVVQPSSTTTYTVTVTNTSNCTATASSTVTVNANPVASITGDSVICLDNTATLEASGGNAYSWSNGDNTAIIAVSPAVTTSYNVTVTNGNNCTATSTFVVLVNQPSFTQLSEAICSNGVYDFNGDILNASGVYYDTLANVNGCDSIVELTLTVNTVDAVSITETICDNSSFDFNGDILTVAGVYEDTLVNQFGCDSIVTLTLNVLATSATPISADICFGDVYDFEGQQISQSGTYIATLTNQNGCDSIITLTLNVLPEIVTNLNASICVGDVYDFEGQQLTAGGQYTQVYQAVNGCDSTIALTLVVNQPTSSSVNGAICVGDSYSFNGLNLTTAGTYNDTLVNANGCDSIITLTLLVNTPVVPVISNNGGILSVSGTYTSYQWYLNGTAINGATNATHTATQTGDYTVEVTDANGCTSTSSIVNVIVGINDVFINNSISIFPSPTTGILNVQMSDAEGVTIAILSLDGKLVATKPATSLTTVIDVTSVASGIYLVQVTKDGQSIYKKFYKE